MTPTLVPVALPVTTRGRTAAPNEYLETVAQLAVGTGAFRIEVPTDDVAGHVARLRLAGKAADMTVRTETEMNSADVTKTSIVFWTVKRVRSKSTRENVVVAPVEVAPVEAAPVEVAPVEVKVAPDKAAPVGAKGAGNRK